MKILTVINTEMKTCKLIAEHVTEFSWMYARKPDGPLRTKIFLSDGRTIEAECTPEKFEQMLTK